LEYFCVIRTLQSKVELMKEERSRSRSRSASGSGEATTAAKPEGENVSCRESNSTDLKRPVKAEEEGDAKQEASGESMAASKGSSASLCRRGGRKGGEEECEEAASAQPLAALLDRVAARFGPVFERLQESQVKIPVGITAPSFHPNLLLFLFTGRRALASRLESGRAR
jgi:hypothetical protein